MVIEKNIWDKRPIHFEMDKVTFIFPGQGSQYVGMARDLYENLPEARHIFDEAEEVLPHSEIKRLCFEGPIEELTQTKNSQVAIFVASIAALEVFRTKIMNNGKWPKRNKIIACAGLSLGELTALVASGSIEFKEALRLVKKRGELMERASLEHPGGMVSILGLSLEVVEDICKDTGAEIANLNCPGQIVISGPNNAIRDAMTLAEERGAKKSILLNVSGPFHSSLMKEAAHLLSIELDSIEVRTPSIPVIANVTGDYENSPEEIKENLVRQLYSTVLWEDSIKRLGEDGCNIFYEIGPGKILKGLLRRIDERFQVMNMGSLQDLEML